MIIQEYFGLFRVKDQFVSKNKYQGVPRKTLFVHNILRSAIATTRYFSLNSTRSAQSYLT